MNEQRQEPPILLSSNNNPPQIQSHPPAETQQQQTIIQQPQIIKQQVVKQQLKEKEEEVKVAMPRLKHKTELDEDSQQLQPAIEEETDRKPKPAEDPQYDPYNSPLHRLSKLKNKKISKKAHESDSSSEQQIQKKRRGRAKAPERKAPRRKEASERGKHKPRGKPKPSVILQIKKELEQLQIPPQEQPNRRQPPLSQSNPSTQPPPVIWKYHQDNDEWDSLDAEVGNESQQRRTGCQTYIKLLDLVNNSKPGGNIVDLVGDFPPPFY